VSWRGGRGRGCVPATARGERKVAGDLRRDLRLRSLRLRSEARSEVEITEVEITEEAAMARDRGQRP